MQLHENVAYHSHKAPPPQRGRGGKGRADEQAGKEAVYEEVTSDKGGGEQGKEPVHDEVILDQERKIPVAAPGEPNNEEAILCV